MNIILRLYEKFVGNPWVYDRLRPLFFGGFDFSELYGWLGDTHDCVLLDVGCGTGAAFQYLKGFRAYHGFDTDVQALERLQKLHGGPDIHLYPEMLTSAHIETLQPQLVLLMGLIHHLPDSHVHKLLETIGKSRSVKRIISLDTLYVPGRPLNNFITWLDRGRYGRHAQQYLNLIEDSPFQVERTQIVPAGNRVSVFWGMSLIPR